MKGPSPKMFAIGLCLGTLAGIGVGYLKAHRNGTSQELLASSSASTESRLNFEPHQPSLGSFEMTYYWIAAEGRRSRVEKESRKETPMLSLSTVHPLKIADAEPAEADSPSQAQDDSSAPSNDVVLAADRTPQESTASAEVTEPETAEQASAEAPAKSHGSVTLFQKQGCKPVATVSASFAKRLRIEGTGRLRDGRLLSVQGSCDCGSSPCYKPARPGHKWGTGVKDRPLSPFRSIAVDPRYVKIGTVLYIPELDGVKMPGNSPWGGFIHDGCVVADDQGGNIQGRQIDLFTANHSNYQALQKTLARKKRVTILQGQSRCVASPVHKAQTKRN